MSLTPSTCRARRLALGVSYGKIALAAECAPGTLRAWEAGRMTVHPTLVAIFERGLSRLERERVS